MKHTRSSAPAAIALLAAADVQEHWKNGRAPGGARPHWIGDVSHAAAAHPPA